MKLTADGGSTKVRWIISDGDRRVADFATCGLNPTVMSEPTLRDRLREALDAHREDLAQVTEAEYYGAGCRGAALEAMERALREVLPGCERVTVGSDMLGACCAVAPAGERSVVCILGTGANSCLYDGERIVANVPPLGYILGDEGSGAWIGTALLHSVLKGLLPERLTDAFYEHVKMDYDEIIRRVYRPDAAAGETANGFLASLAPFASEHIAEEAIERMIREGFGRFFDANVMLYDGVKLLTVNFVGSVAAAFEPQLRAEGARRGLTIGSVKRAPLD